MDLNPFTWIDPCGYSGLKVTDMKSVGVACRFEDVQMALVKAVSGRLHLESEQ